MAALSNFRAAASSLIDRMRFANFAGITFGGRRDLYQILGYSRVLTFFDFYDRYMRDGVAKAVVEAYPVATWRGGVEVFEDEDPDTDTEFEQAFKALDAKFNFWQKCQQVDLCAGLSTFAVLLIGAPGPVNEPLQKGGELLFLKPYFGGGGPSAGMRQARAGAYEASASVQSYDADPTSSRFGEPLTYSLRTYSTPGVPSFTNVHWTRVIHVAEGTLEDDVFGIPTLQCVFNLFDDLAKLTGGGSEAFWLRANQGLHLDVDKDMGLPGQVSAGLTPAERESLRDKAEEMQHQLQRVLVTRGVTVKELGSDVANFALSGDFLLKQIAGAARIPMRILTGSEMGTLASEQDAANFDSRVQDRRTGYAGPKIVRRILDRLIEYGYLPTPKSYEVGWPVEENMDEAGKATFAKSLAEVNQLYGATIFDDVEIRDMAFDKKPLPEKQGWENLTEIDKATLAAKLALVNKEMGITVYTDDEIRQMSHGFAPLSDAEKVPIGAPEKISVAAPPKIGEDGLPVAAPVDVNAPAMKAALRALEEAIEAEDGDAVMRILASPLPPESQTFQIEKGLTRSQAVAEAKKRSKKDFRGVTYDPKTGTLKVLAGEYKFSTTQVQLPESFLGFGLTIPDADLDAQGRETDPHVTLKYGLHTSDPEIVRAALAGKGPITFTLGKTDYFAADGYDVLFVEVQSEDLRRLNAYVAKTLDVTDTQPRYIPHATVAYLKSGLGPKYAGLTEFEGQQHVASQVTFSSSDGERTVLNVSSM